MSGDPWPDEAGPSPVFASALANEQFILQSVSSSTISESSGRAALYLSALSSGLVAIGFASASDSILSAITFTVLPTVFLLGCFTVVRLIDTSVENLVVLRRIERIRRYWVTLSRDGERFFEADSATGGHRGVRYGTWAMLFTTASMVIVVNAVVAGSIVTVFLVRVEGLTRAVGVPIGAGVALVIAGSALVYQHSRITRLVLGAEDPGT